MSYFRPSNSKRCATSSVIYLLVCLCKGHADTLHRFASESKWAGFTAEPRSHVYTPHAGKTRVKLTLQFRDAYMPMSFIYSDVNSEGKKIHPHSIKWTAPSFDSNRSEQNILSFSMIPHDTVFPTEFRETMGAQRTFL